MNTNKTIKHLELHVISTLRKIRKVIYRNIQDPYIHLISYPKTGRTWLRSMIGKVLCEKYGMNEGWLLETYHWQKFLGTTMSVHHDDTIQPWKNPHFSKMPTNKTKYSNNKVLFLVRDPRDIVVSYYFEMTKRKRFYQVLQQYTGTISEFIRDERFGIKRTINFYNIWHQNKNIPVDFFLIRYEDMHTDPHTILIRTLKFLGLDNIEKCIINTAVNYAGFENLRKIEKEGILKTDELYPIKIQDPESYKVRKGKIGGFADYLTEDDIAYLNKTISEMGCAFYPELKNIETIQ